MVQQIDDLETALAKLESAVKALASDLKTHTHAAPIVEKESPTTEPAA